MATVSIAIVQGLMVYRLISNVRVRRTRSRYTTYIDRQHHGISADILEIKWGIVLDKTNCNLQSITQDIVRSSLKPMPRRYRTDFLSQILLALNCRFYMDALFVNDKLIFGNT